MKNLLLVGVLFFGAYSFAQTIEEKNLALARNYMLKNNLEYEHVQINLVNAIDDNTWNALKSKILGLESVYYITLSDDNKNVSVKSYLVNKKTLEYKLKNSIQSIIGNEVVFNYHNEETIDNEKITQD